MPQLGKLVICPTPIGNLGDMTPRALEALRTADDVCAEDTRVTGKLLAAFNVSARLVRLDEAMLSAKAARVIEDVLAGKTVAYCSDAGMPGVSDPGLRLVRAAHEAGATVEVLPGASALTCAYVASGFDCPRLYFGGFFPRKSTERISVLEQLKSLDAVLVFYESPKRIASALAVVAEVFPLREVAVCRELTKLHEEVVRGAAPQVAAEFDERSRADAIKGEIVLVIAPASAEEDARAAEDAQRSAADRAAELRAQGEYSAKDIATTLRREFGISRNEAYSLAVGQDT